MIARHMARVLRRYASEYPVITLTGPRQSGKTTLARATFPDKDYVSLEDPDRRAFALEDPRGFLAQFRGSAILDEVQHVPELFSYIQSFIDERQATGQFLLTGSQNFLLAERISQSLAGRAAICHLLPLAQTETSGRRAALPSAIGRRVPRTRPDKGELMDVLHRGFLQRTQKP